MNTAMALLYLRAAWIYGTTYASVAMTQALLLLDAVLSFSIAFAAVYGVVTLARRVIPAAPGGRPRAWAVPLVFAGAAAPLAGLVLLLPRRRILTNTAP